MKVKWTEDLRPMPGEYPFSDDEYNKVLSDKSLIVEHKGEVIATHRSLMGYWYFLVLCEDGKLRERDSRWVEILNKGE